MKLNFAIFKKGKTLYWVLGGIVIFVLFYLMFNKGAPASGGITSVSTGPSDAAVAASTSLAMAQTQANAGVAVATLQYNGTIAQTQAAADVAKYTATLDAQTQTAAFNTQKQIAAINAEYSYDTAKVAAETNIAQWTINAGVLTNQLAAQRDMFLAATKATTIGVLASQVGQVKANDRDNVLTALIASSSGQSLNFYDPGHSIYQLGPAA